jgi:hypothetical protein
MSQAVIEEWLPGESAACQFDVDLRMLAGVLSAAVHAGASVSFVLPCSSDRVRCIEHILARRLVSETSANSPGLGEMRFCIRSGRVALRFAAERPAAHERGKHAPLILAKPPTLTLHDAGRQSSVDMFGAHFANGGRQMRAFDGGVSMARHALFLENREAGFRTGCTLRPTRRGCLHQSR